MLVACITLLATFGFSFTYDMEEGVVFLIITTLFNGIFGMYLCIEQGGCGGCNHVPYSSNIA